MISSFCSNKLWEPVITGVICSLGLAWRLHYSDQSWGDSVVSGACPDCLALCITLVLLVAKHHHWQTVTRLNYFYGYSPTRNVGSIFQMMGIWCGSIILNKTDLIWNWICLFQFCFEARVDTKGGERERGAGNLCSWSRDQLSVLPQGCQHTWCADMGDTRVHYVTVPLMSWVWIHFCSNWRNSWRERESVTDMPTPENTET